ncbi:MAG: agaA 3 [Sphingobacteriaceae bacterium]|nr:agaA 3 [Sphingobacteriaceae bacterium]
MLVCLLAFTNLFAQVSLNLKKDWFYTMLDSKQSAKPGAKINQPDLWKALRGNFTDSKQLMQMSWEERDKIWDAPDAFSYNSIAQNYAKAYEVSCNERGVKPKLITANVNDLNGLLAVRNAYLDSRAKEYVILTPKAPLTPQINGPAVYGVRPGHPLLYKIPVTGQKPVKLTVSGLPAGCKFDAKTGIISGSVIKAGDYKLSFSASNTKGKAGKIFTLRVGNDIALTPPMGWNSWNSFASDVTSQNIRDAANSIVKSGLDNYGWSFINIDDCWMRKPTGDDPIFAINSEIRAKLEAKDKSRITRGKVRFNEEEQIGKVRDNDGFLLSNKDFPDMKGLSDYIHSLGLKAGLYISPGPFTCQGYIGSYGHEKEDAIQFARWGFDYLKYDWCGYSTIATDKELATFQKPYQDMHKQLAAVDRDIVYSLCQYGMGDVWKWGKDVGGNLWRTTGDIRDNWESMTKIGFAQAGKEAYAGPGHWNDPDMLVVGYVGWSKNLRPTYLSPNEQYTHVSLWSLLSAPMIIGADLTKLDDFTFNLLANPEVIAVNQDVLGKQAVCVVKDGDIQVWSKPLADGSIAVGVFNTGETPVNYKLDFNKLNLSGSQMVRDVWRQQNVGKASKAFSTSVNRHGVSLLVFRKA